MVVCSGPTPRHRVVLLLLLLLGELVENLLMLDIEACDFMTLALVPHGLEECTVLDEERSHEGGICALSHESCLSRVVLILLGLGGDPNRRCDGGGRKV